MVLDKYLILISFLISMLQVSTLGQETIENDSGLPILETKQDITNIRYVSSDGKYTYYQRNNGSLQFSTNYEVKEVIKLSPHTDYEILSSLDRKKLIVTARENYHSSYAFRSTPDIYVLEMGTNNIKKVAKGLAIGLHLDDQWFSFYNPFSKMLTLQSTQAESLKYEIKLANNKNPYFIPDVTLIDNDTMIYTDINKEGIPGVLRFKLNSKDIRLVHKTDSHLRSLEVCSKDEELFILDYGLDPMSRGSKILKYLNKDLDKLKSSSVYESSENDLGSLICSLEKNRLFFVATTRDSVGKIATDAIELNVLNGSQKALSNFGFVTNILLLDDKLILPYQGKNYILKGKNNLTKFDKIKAQ